MGEVLIKNLEMPKHCAMCGFHGAMIDPMISQHFCKITGEKILNPYKGRLDNCQLIYVPPHGDLIDRGYAIATACSGRIRTLPTTEDGENWIRVEEVRESIKAAPTIIPAEEGE